ncbi:MAG TPA: hypothetical protein VIH18_18320 [Candidatus Binatia bacterium]|jgi:hypothetical protein
MRSFVAGITEAIAYIKRRPGEAKGILQKYTRVSDSAILQHTYDSEIQYMEPVPHKPGEGIKTILGELGVTGQPAETLIAEFIDNRFVRQLSDDGLLRQIYPGGIPSRCGLQHAAGPPVQRYFVSMNGAALRGKEWPCRL